MLRRAALILSLLCVNVGLAEAQDYVREPLRIPFAMAGPRGLEAMLVRPAGNRRYPLALISHGAPRDPKERANTSTGRYYRQAIEFARRGFAALVLVRRGYGDSDGLYAESAGRCTVEAYLDSAKESARDLRAGIDAMRTRTDVSTQGMIAVGQSAGGLASIALAADAPLGLAAVINFAGGRGSRGDKNVCREDNLVSAFGELGKTARVPMLWVYAENDLYFWPELARQFHAAFQASGGRAKFIAAPSFGTDGHTLFTPRGMSIWTPMVDEFLRDQNLGSRTLLAPPALAQLPPPPQLRERAREAFTQYLQAGPNKAFAVAKSGRFGWRSGLRSEREARIAATETCEKTGESCAIYAVNDELERLAESRSKP